MPREIVTIGGGTGSPVINEALLRTGQVDHIDAVAAMFDSGGATGRRRLNARGNEVAYADGLKILRSLIRPDSDNPAVATFIRWISNRNERDEVLGQEIMDRFFDQERGFAQIEHDAQTFGIPLLGRVLPSSTVPAHIVFQDDLGRQFSGEHNLDYQRLSAAMVVKMDLEPSVPVFPKTAKTVENASRIVLACGSMHGSVLSNFLPVGMKEALAKSKAEVYMVTNLTSTRNENHEYTPLDFVEKVEEYSGRRIDGLIIPEMTRQEFESEYPTVAEAYAKDHSFFLGWEDSDLYRAADEGIQIIQHQATNLVTSRDGLHVVRHSPEMLAQAMTQIFPASS